MSFHNFRGQRTSINTRSRRGYSQASTRHHVTGYDQYGRKWGFEVENDSGAPCSIPVAEFAAPFMPDPEFVFVNPDNATEVYVDNIGIARSRRNALRAYHAEAVQYASDNKQPIPEIGEYSGVIKEKVGQPPRAFQPFLAAEQGNPWVLGWDPISRTPFAGRPDPRLEQYIENTSRSFEEEFGDFDYGASSYSAAVAGKKQKAPRYKSFEALQRSTGGFLDGMAEPMTDDQFLNEPGAELSASEQELVKDVNDATSDLEALGTNAHEAEELVGFEDLGDEQDHDGSAVGDGDESGEGDLVDELDAKHDPEALGGRTVRPDQQERADRQAPRHGNASARRKGGNRTWDPNRAKGKSLADGARPAIGGE